MKYLRIARYNEERSKDNIIIIFPENVDHSEMTACFKDCTVVSAGFVELDNNNVNYNYCYGKSISLQLECIPEEDTELLIRQYWDSFIEHLN